MNRVGLLSILLSGCAWISAADREAFEDQDDDHVPYDLDCDDNDPEALLPDLWFVDADGDGWGDPERTERACALRPGLVDVGRDCDDSDPTVSDAITYWADLDGDGYGTGAPATGCAPPESSARTEGDCDDDDPATHPGAVERCDVADIDEDCDGLPNDLDPEGALDRLAWFADSDGDAYGDSTSDGTIRCDPIADEVPNDDDCDDQDPAIHPGVGETCGGGDEDCDFRTDDADDDVIDPTPWYRDADQDGHGDPANATYACSVGAGRVAAGDDCDDLRADVGPGALEVCDQGKTDEDCDGPIDDLDPSVTGTTAWFADLDEDGFGDATDVMLRCAAPVGRVADAGDCDDDQPLIGPGTVERCDALDLDEDCDGQSDDEDDDTIGQVIYYVDADADGFGSQVGQSWCGAPPGLTTTDTDCDDGRQDTHPGAVEVWCDGVDQSCDGADKTAEVWYDGVDQDCDGGSDGDQDGDGFDAKGYGPGADCDDKVASVFPGALEFMDGVDSNCDGKDFVCGNVTRRVPLDHATIDAAIAAACPGDTVLAAPGTYAVNLNVTKAITLDGPGARLIPASAAGSVITATRGRYKNFTVADGTAANAGMAVSSGAGVRVEGVRFENNQGTTGGGLSVRLSPLTQVIDCAFVGNTANDGAGLMIFDSDDALVRGCTFDKNTSKVDGGGMLTANSDRVAIESSEFTNNTAGDDGGALQISSAADTLVRDTLLLSNTAGGDGGAISNGGRRTIVRNVDVGFNAAGSGNAGLFSVGDDGLIEDSTFSDNLGDAVEFNSEFGQTIDRCSFERNEGSGLGLNVWGAGSSVIEDCTFADNLDSALWTNGATVTVRRADFDRSTADEGAAMYLSAEDLLVEDVTVAHSDVGPPWGAAVWVSAGQAIVRGLDVRVSDGNALRVFADTLAVDELVAIGAGQHAIDVNVGGAVTLDHVTAVNTSQSAIYVLTGSPVTITNTLLAYDTLGIYAPASTAISSCAVFGNTGNAAGGVSASACLSANPEFVTWGRRLDPIAHDLHLAPGSPLFNAGDPTQQDNDGTRADIGAYGGPIDVFDSIAYYADSDSDGIYDGYEAAHGLAIGEDDAASDLDGDAVTNLAEFTAGTAADVVDTDGDGKNDGQEKTAATDPLDPFDP